MRRKLILLLSVLASAGIGLLFARYVFDISSWGLDGVGVVCGVVGFTGIVRDAIEGAVDSLDD